MGRTQIGLHTSVYNLFQCRPMPVYFLLLLATATRAPDKAFFCLFNKCLSGGFPCSSRLSASDYKYSQQALLDIWKSKINNGLDTTTETTIKELGLLRQPVITPDMTATTAPTKRRRKRCARKRKRCKRGGIRARLAATPTRLTMPSIIMANVRSLDNKMDHNCCVFVFTETWLNDNIPDSAVHLEQLTCYRADRALVNGGKQRGGGVCVYTHEMRGARTLW